MKFKEIYLNITKNKTINILFYIGIVLYAFSRVYQYSSLFDFSSTIKSLLRLLSFVFILPRIVFNDYSKKDIYVILLLYLTTFICICFGGDKNLIEIPTVLVGMKNYDVKKIIKMIFYVTISAVIVHCIAFMFVYTKENGSFISMFHISGYPIKNTIMYYDNNMFAIRYTFALMQYMYLTNRNDNRYIKTIIIVILNVFILLISQARTEFIVDMLLVIYMLLENVEIFRKNINILKYISMIFGILSSILLSVLYDNNISIINKISYYLSGRPFIFSKACKYMGIHLLPDVKKFDNMSKVFNRYMLPDNSYISVFLKWGLLVSICILILVYILAVKQKNDNIINYFIGIMAIWFIVEYISMEVVLYIVPLVLMNTFFENNKK